MATEGATLTLEEGSGASRSGAPLDPLMSGRDYLDSLNDGREVWINGERVKSVAAHPAFRNSARMMARLYDAMHDPETADVLTIEMEGHPGRRTHRYFQAPRTVEEQVAARDAVATWSRLTYGWMGRTPDYKGAWVATLAGSGDYYGEYQENAKRWYDIARARVPFINHALVNPPVDRHLPNQSSDIFVQVEKETDAGLVVSGAKVVATAAALTNYTFVAHVGTAYKDKKFSPIFIIPTGTPGVKLICRNSYEFNAAIASTPFESPLSSRLDENDSILVLDKVLVPWENVFNYNAERANMFMQISGNFSRALLQASTRMAVKLDFIGGAYIRAVEIIGNKESRSVQAAVGEVVALRHLVWSLSDAMARNPDPWGEFVLPNEEAALAFRTFAGDAYSRVRNLIYKTIGSGLIYLPSEGRDLANPELRGYLEKYVRGVGGIGAEERIKTLKLLWDAISSEFGARHELYELNYSGSYEQTHVDPYLIAGVTGRAEAMKSLVGKCLSEYDLDGWKAPDLINATDLKVRHAAE